VLLEVIACSVHDAIEAERGGAGRLELVREFPRGGLTPPPGVVEEIRKAVRIPIRVMIREVDGYQAGNADDINRLARLARRFASLGIDGLVLGFLEGRGIDVAAMDAVLAAGAPIPATFHHAFDDLPDPIGGLGDLARWPQIDRVLTSGGGGDWSVRAARLERWRSAAAVGILPGGGVDRQALKILSRTSLAEVHIGRAARVPPTVEGRVSSREVAELVEAAGG
jgi:copper homeostasis protein